MFDPLNKVGLHTSTDPCSFQMSKTEPDADFHIALSKQASAFDAAPPPLHRFCALANERLCDVLCLAQAATVHIQNKMKSHINGSKCTFANSID